MRNGSPFRNGHIPQKKRITHTHTRSTLVRTLCRGTADRPERERPGIRGIPGHLKESLVTLVVVVAGVANRESSSENESEWPKKKQ